MAGLSNLVVVTKIELLRKENLQLLVIYTWHDTTLFDYVSEQIKRTCLGSNDF